MSRGPRLKTRSKWGRVYCLETASWDANDVTDRSSVLPILEIMKAAEPGEFEFVHRPVRTEADLRHYLERWIEDDLDYHVLYLGFHGDRDLGICFDDDTTMTLESLGTYLGSELPSDLSDCVIHLGSCSIVKSEKAVSEFFRATRAKAVLGYTEDTPWIDSAAMDLLALGTLAHYKRLGDALNYLEGNAYQSLTEPPVGFKVKRRAA